eukprot:SAG31_NODE_480_length_15108_cov_56.073423_8_plen_57_part_00
MPGVWNVQREDVLKDSSKENRAVRLACCAMLYHVPSIERMSALAMCHGRPMVDQPR